MTRFWPLALAAVPLLLIGARSDYSSVQRKFDLIQSGRVKAGSRMSFTDGELNAYVQQEVLRTVPQGVRDPKLELGAGTATGSATIDFLKLQHASGNPPGWLMRQLLQGEHPVTVTVRILAANGRATVDVQSVDISGVTIEGRLLDYLIHNYLNVYYPDAKIDQPFEMSYGIDHLDIQPSRVDVYFRK